MKIIITGATGFVGKWLVNQLLYQQDEVTVIVRDKNKIPPEWFEKVHIIEKDMLELGELDKKDFMTPSGDIFFHLGWTGTSGELRANTVHQLENVRVTCEAVRLAKRLECARFVYAGSIMEYEAMKYIPENGSTPAAGNVYSVMKMTADFCAKIIANQENIDYINVVISNIYGAGERSARFINTMLIKMLNNEDIPLTHGNQLYDFIYVSDAVKAIIMAAKQGEKNSVYYIGNTEQRSLKSFVLEMKEVLKSASVLRFGEVPFKGPMLSYTEFEVDKIMQLGFKPVVTFAEGIELTKIWLTEGKCDYSF